MKSWSEVRRRFRLDPGISNFATMVVASHPAPVRRAIARHRRGLDVRSHAYFDDTAREFRDRALMAAGAYFDVHHGLVALTHSTTMGLAQILGGIRIHDTSDIVTGANEHPATIETLDARKDRDGTPFRMESLYSAARTASIDEILTKTRQALTPSTRVLTLSWVNSSDGLKAPVARIAEIVADVNKTRAEPHERLLFVVDGVHGFGIEASTFAELGCDLFISGTHKSIFGPRGTGVIYGKADAWPQVAPMTAKLSGANHGAASRHTPGGVKAYEHWWSLNEAFEMHLRDLGKEHVEREVHRQAAYLKGRLNQAGAGITVITPESPALSSGIVCLDVGELAADDVITQLEAVSVLVSESAIDRNANRTHVRMAVSILTTDAEIDHAVECLTAIGNRTALPMRPAL